MTNSAVAALPEAWKKKFELIEKAGGPKQPNARALTAAERYNINFNFWGLLFGPFYYFAKGMWKKALVLWILTIVVIVIISMLLAAMGIPDQALGFAGGVIFAVRANIDYYKKVVLGDNGWW